MVTIPLDQFVRQLDDSTLMSADDVAALIDSLPAEKKPHDGEQLAKELVRLKKLTAYQAQQIYAGKGRTLVLGNYVILEKLGQGGMGLVLKAEHRRMERLVALKVLSPKVTKSPEAVRRFQREVKAAARLEHPNIVTAYDADEAGGTHFLVTREKGVGSLLPERPAGCFAQETPAPFFHPNELTRYEERSTKKVLYNDTTHGTGGGVGICPGGGTGRGGSEVVPGLDGIERRESVPRHGPAGAGVAAASFRGPAGT